MGFPSTPKGPFTHMNGSPAWLHLVTIITQTFAHLVLSKMGALYCREGSWTLFPIWTENYFSIPITSCHTAPAIAHKTMSFNDHFVNVVLYIRVGTTCSFFFIFEHTTHRPNLSYCSGWVFADKRALSFNIDTEQNTPQLPGNVWSTNNQGRTKSDCSSEGRPESDFELKLRELS